MITNILALTPLELQIECDGSDGSDVRSGSCTTNAKQQKYNHFAFKSPPFWTTSSTSWANIPINPVLLLTWDLLLFLIIIVQKLVSNIEKIYEKTSILIPIDNN